MPELGIDAVAGALETCLAELLRQRLVQEISVPNPAAGAEWSIAVPNVAYWELLAVSYQLTTSAVVANRRSSLLVKDPGGLVVGESDAIAVQAASLTTQYCYQQDLGSPQSAVALTQAVPVFGVPLVQGWTIGSATAAKDAGDQYKSVTLVVREWTAQELVRQAEFIARHFPDLALS